MTPYADENKLQCAWYNTQTLDRKKIVICLSHLSDGKIKLNATRFGGMWITLSGEKKNNMSYDKKITRLLTKSAYTTKLLGSHAIEFHSWKTSCLMNKHMPSKSKHSNVFKDILNHTLQGNYRIPDLLLLRKAK